MSPVLVGGIATTLLFILLALNVPIAIALGCVGSMGLLYIGGWDLMIDSLKFYPFAKVGVWALACLPLFIIMGHLALGAGITQKAFGTAHKLAGQIPGGLGVATILTCGMFAACTGSSGATAATVGRVAIPEMRRYGYDKKLAAGITACGGLLGILIPPSTVFVLYGFATGVSIGKLLMSGIFPGLLTIAIYSMGIIGIALLNPEVMPKAELRISWKTRLASLKDLWGIIIVIGIIVGGIYTGVFTPVEASGIAALTTLVMALSRGRKTLPIIREGLEDSVRVTSMIFFIIVGSSLFSAFLALSGVTKEVARIIVSLPLHDTIILILCLAIYIPLGMIIDTISMMLITLPIIYPVIISLGFNGIWFGVLIVKLSELALVSPPVGTNLYVTKGIAPADTSLEDVIRGSFPFMLMELVTLSILAAFPMISLFLPLRMK